jgi:hypothetical protein
MGGRWRYVESPIEGLESLGDVERVAVLGAVRKDLAAPDIDHDRIAVQLHRLPAPLDRFRPFHASSSFPL